MNKCGSRRDRTGNEDYWGCKSSQASIHIPCPFTALFRARYEAGDKQGGYIIRCLGGDDQERRHLYHSLGRACLFCFCVVLPLWFEVSAQNPSRI